MRVNFSRLFRSRWAALWWAAGVVWLAYDVASAAPDTSPPTATTANASEITDVTGAPVNASDVGGLLNALDS